MDSEEHAGSWSGRPASVVQILLGITPVIFVIEEQNWITEWGPVGLTPAPVNLLVEILGSGLFAIDKTGPL